VLLASAVAAAMVLVGARVLADDAASIETNYASGTAGVVYDNTSGDYPVITAIMSEDNGFTTNGHTYANWAIVAQDSTGSLDLFGHFPVSETNYMPAVGDKITVLLDSGIRRGSDIVKAVALGAKCVLTGRATLYGTAVGGELGASKAINIIQTEMDKTMAYTGCNRVDEITTDIFFGDRESNRMAAN